MSADDGIYILATKGPEYRIAHLSAVDNLYDEYNVASVRWTPNVPVVVEAFEKSKVFSELTEAWDSATMLEDRVGMTEYGVSLISDFGDYLFSDLEERNGKSESSK